jgi:copper resistance protein D
MQSRPLVILIASVLLALNLPARTAAQFLAEPGTNPIAADATSLARGQELYGQSCAMCHGFQGRGDGPLARTMIPRPSDFRVHMAEGHTEAQLFDWISNGVPDTAMPSYGNELGEQDRWHLINYLQTFAPPTP